MWANLGAREEAIPRLSVQINRLDLLLVGGRVLLLAVALALISRAAAGQSPLFDSHVHLWKGEKSLRAYEEQLREGRLDVVGIGAMWFGGPNQALAGRPKQIRAGNDGIIALAAQNPKIMPIATVHPYDGPAAVSELERVAAKGIKVVKIHPQTQKFDPDDPRVLTLVRRAGELAVVALIDNANILPGDSEKLFNLALKAPKTKVVFAHLGTMNSASGISSKWRGQPKACLAIISISTFRRSPSSLPIRRSRTNSFGRCAMLESITCC